MTPTFDAIGLVVTDMSATLTFYRDLGLDLPAGLDSEPHAEAPLPGGLRLMFDAGAEPAPAAGPVALAFRCAGPAEVDSTYARMVAAGHHGEKEPWDAFWGQRYATLRDPDGTAVDLFAPLG